MQDFVKTKFEKLNKKIDRVSKAQKAGVSIPTGESDSNVLSTVGKDHPIMNALEESLKWKVEAQNRKQSEMLAQMEDRI